MYMPTGHIKLLLLVGAEEADLEQACQASKCACTAQGDAKSAILDQEVSWPLARPCNSIMSQFNTMCCSCEH